MSYLLLFRHGLPLDLEECNIRGATFVCFFCVKVMKLFLEGEIS